MRCDAPEAPHISVHYELNVAEMSRADGTERSPQTSADLARMDCHGGVTVLRDLRLLDQPAVACEGPAHRIRDVAAVYGLAPRAAGMTRPTTR